MERPVPAPRRRTTSERPKPQGHKKIRVRSLPHGCTRESLELCFESKRKFGRQLSLDEVEFDQENREAVICYKTDEDTDTVLETCDNQDLTLDGARLEVQLYEEEKEPCQTEESERFSVVAGSNEDVDDDDGHTVEVSGLTKETTEDTLTYYFTNPRKGGGDIKRLTVDKEEMKAVIEFKNKEVVDTLLQKKHTIGGRTINVRRFSYSKTDLLLKGLTEDIPEETLILYIEAKLVPEFKLVINQERTRALIQSDKPINFENAFEKCRGKPIENVFLEPCRVPVTNGIIVTNIPEATEDTFRFYFESKKSGGGEKEVEKVELNRQENYCLVFFERSEAVHPVCRQLKHSISQTDLTVCPYYTSLGVPASADTEAKFTLPDPIDLSQEDKYKIKFISSNSVQIDTVNSRLKDHHARLAPENNAVECTLTTAVKSYRTLAKRWRETTLDALQTYLKSIDVRVKQIDETCRDEILAALGEIDLSDPDQVAVYAPRGSANVVFVGIEGVVKSEWQNIDRVITTVENKIKEERSVVEESKDLKVAWKVAYLKKQFVANIKRQYSDLEINLYEEKAQVCFRGRKENVRQAEIEMFDQLQKVQETKYKLREKKAKLLQKEPVVQKINERFKTQYKDCVWSVKDDELLLYGEDTRDLFDMQNTIEDYVTEVAMRLDSVKSDILQSADWRNVKDKLVKICNGCVEINWNKKDNTLEVITVEEYENIVSDELDTFFEKHAVYEEEFKCDPNIRKFLCEHKVNEIKGTKGVILKQDHILLKGTRAEVTDGRRILNKIKEKIMLKEDVLTKPGVHGYFSSEEGKNCIERTQKSIPCLIMLQRENRSSGDHKNARQEKLAFSKPTKCAEAKLPSGLSLEVFGGDMTELNVDVLVNASNNKLEHAGGLAAVVLRKGGNSIQDECTDHVNSNGQLEEGDVFMSKAGNLSCKEIAHALGPVWKGGSKQEEDILKRAIEKCLSETEKRNFSSIAIPALSTGAFHYPADRACRAIVEQVTEFSRDSKSVRRVVLCDINVETVKCFIAALKQFTRDVKIHYTLDLVHHGPAWLHTDDSAKGFTRDKERRKSSLSPDRNTRRVEVEVVQDELSKQKVDVIVNSTSKDLRLDKGIASKAISRAAGGDMQKECSRRYSDGIMMGEVAVTGGYNLKCKKVYHIAVNSYERGQGALKDLWKVVENCLTEANKHGASSIAFPPIGCGSQKYPVKEAASTMLQSIAKFIENTPNTSLELIRIVIYTEDHDKFEVFISEKRRCNIKSPHAQKETHKRRLKYGQVINVYKGSAHFRLDCLDVKITQGDITNESTDAIVASCNLDLDLTKGAVTKALLQKGGAEIRKDCEKQKATMKKEHIAVTNAGNLGTKYIIHIDTQYKTKNWLRPVEQCLQKAEELGIASLAFPTLGIIGRQFDIKATNGGAQEMQFKVDGFLRILQFSPPTRNTNMPTSAPSRVFKQVRVSFLYNRSKMNDGVGCSPEGIADVMHEALTNFTKNKTVKNLQEIRIIVFQSDIVDSFIRALKNAIEGTDRDRSPPKSRGSQSSKEQTDQGSDKVSFRVYAEGEQNCRKAIKQLTTGVETEWNVSNLEDSIILTLPQKKVDEIKREAKNNSIQIDIDHDLGQIKFHGLVKNMMPVKDKVNAILRSHEKSKHEHQQAKLLANIVKWFYIKNHKQYPFPDDWNKIIEEAFSKKDPKVKVKDRSGGEYEIDFSSMTEYDVKHPQEKFTVLRRDVIAESSKELPKSWKPMGENQNLVLVDLKQSDPEYASILKQFQKSLHRTPTIIKIERIQNQALYTQYAAKRKQMEQQNSHRKDNQRVLWHGTAAEAVQSINHHGFNRSYCGKNAVAIGNGVYFAVHANYSDQGTYTPVDSSGHKRMYRCLVLTGDYCNGHSGMRTPPQKQGQQSHILYDSVTNSRSNPIMFVIFHDCQAYPEHIITYK